MNKTIIALFAAGSLLAGACTEAAETTAAVDDAMVQKAAPTQSSKPIKPGAEPAEDRDVVNAAARKAFAQVPTGAYEIDKEHGYIAFTYVHQGYSKPHLRWRNWDSTLNWNSENPDQSSVNVTIQVDSIDSGVDRFDDHLRSDGWFDAEKNPTITFASTGLRQVLGTKGQMTGDLTMMGVTKPVTLDVTFNKGGDRRGGGHKMGFSASGKLLRSEWNLGKYVPAVGDEVELIIEVEYQKLPEE